MRRIEFLLFQTRLLVIVPVLLSLLVALMILILSAADSFSLFGRMLQAFDPALSAEARAGLDKEILSKVVGLIDAFLLGAFMIVFSFGLYELFIGKIDIVENSEVMERLLLIRTLDDLKSRLANVVLLILIVKFFQTAINIKFENASELLFLSVGIVLIGGTLYLTSKAGH